jgi:DNA-3-methyladenine glycosylase
LPELALDSILKTTKLRREFYERPTLQVARELLGKHLVFENEIGKLSARIVEVEAYIGKNDPACHASRGMTKRNAVMFGAGGYSYIYFVYGMHYCLNVVTERENRPAAVLLRAAEPAEGLEIMQKHSPGKKVVDILRGPGRFCRAFGLTTHQSGLDLTKNTLYLEQRESDTKMKVKRTTRVGINVGTDKLWRFYIKGSPSVSAIGTRRDSKE